MTQTGILVIAHGSRNKKWVRFIEEAVSNVKTTYPICIGYLELVEGKSIPDSVRKLEVLGVQKIIAIPLFVCSGSTHLEEIKYALGLISNSRIPTDLPLIHPQAEVLWASPMDDHSYVLQIVAERIEELSSNPTTENLLLIAHGSDVPGFHEQWEETLRKLCSHLQEQYHFQSTSYATLHPDNIRERVENVSPNQNRLIIPLFLSEGYFTTQLIPLKLEGLSYKYKGRTFLPDHKVTKWIEEKINEMEGE